jgi:copper chaperone CopZ
MAVEFVVEQAGCESCAELIRDGLGEIGAIRRVEVDETADVAAVCLELASDVSSDDVDRILLTLAEESGHGYCVQPGSWRVLSG